MVHIYEAIFWIARNELTPMRWKRHSETEELSKKVSAGKTLLVMVAGRRDSAS